jgi:hypothetical protein
MSVILAFKEAISAPLSATSAILSCSCFCIHCKRQRREQRDFVHATVHVMSENARCMRSQKRGFRAIILFQKSEATTSKSRARSRLRLDSSSNALRRCSQLRVALQCRDIKQTYLPRKTVEKYGATMRSSTAPRCCSYAQHTFPAAQDRLCLFCISYLLFSCCVKCSSCARLATSASSSFTWIRFIPDAPNASALRPPRRRTPSLSPCIRAQASGLDLNLHSFAIARS